MKTEFVTITPKVAEAFLKSNKNNRPVANKRVLLYAEQMKKGQWKDTGESIKFAKSGKLLDGQHRLHAIIKSQTPLRLMVIKDLENNAGDVLDTGKPRNSADVLAMNGIPNSVLLSGTARFILSFENGKYFNSKDPHKSFVVPNQTVLSFVKKNPGLTEICLWCEERYREFKVPNTLSAPILSGLYYIFAKKNATQVDEFFEMYSSGIDLKGNSPIYLLRQRFISEGSARRKLPPKDKIALFIIAWNAFISKKPMEALTFKSGQAFPKPL